MSATVSASSTRLRQQIWRFILLIHRYIGIGVGLVVLLWCTSGVVLMYVQYPALDPDEQLIALQPLELNGCCASLSRPQDSALAVAQFRVQQVVDRLVMYATLSNGEQISLDLKSGLTVDAWSADILGRVAGGFAERQSWQPAVQVQTVNRDQWTVHGRFNPHRPLEKFSNANGRQWYVSATTAEVVQTTTTGERFWNWIGAVTHWIYPTVIRQHTGTWAQLVIWLTIIGLFLTVTGIAVGIRNFRFRSNRRRSPYRGWALWHHYSGLLFGLMTLIWLASGLLSMNPWGALEGRSIAAERNRLNGANQSLSESVASLRAALPAVPGDTVRISSAYWLGNDYVLAANGSGDLTRLFAGGRAESLDPASIQQAARLLTDHAVDIDLLDREDAYYFSLHDRIELPVYRIHTSDDERYYLSALSGQLLAHFDANRRWYRWLFEGLHRGDFHQLIRQRPLWDLLMLLLLIGVTVGVASGVYLGWQRIRPGK